MSLHKKYLPVFQFNEVHSAMINASSREIFNAILELKFSGSLIIRILFAMRGLRGDAVKGIEGLKNMGFTMLEIKEEEELILGLIGQFWKPDGNIQKVSPDDFLSWDESGFAKATWNFKIERLGETCCKVVTETRVACTDERVAKRFGCYWSIIKPFSGLIRIEILRQIKKSAEGRKTLAVSEH